MKRLGILFLAATISQAAPVIWTVCSSGCTTTSVQTAVNNAVTAQDASLPTSCVPYILVLTAGQTFTEQVTLKNRTCGQYIRIRSSRLGELTANVRATSAQSALMAKITWTGITSDSTILTQDSAGYYALEGLEITVSDIPTAIVSIGSGIEDTFAKLPHHFFIDRNWIHGNHGADGPTRGIGLNGGQNIIITNNSITDNHKNGFDAQAIACLQCIGPIYLRNNMLSGSGENFLSGGGGCFRSGSFPGAPFANTSCIFIDGASQSNITFLGNYLWKDPDWFSDTDVTNPFGPHTAVPTRPCLVGEHYLRSTGSQWYVCTDAAGTWATEMSGPAQYTTKNLFEVKDARRLVLTGNYLQNTVLSTTSPNDGGFTINQNGNSTANYDVQDITVTGNRFDSIMSVGSLGNSIYIYPGLNPFWHNNAITRTRRVSITNNVYSNVSSLAVSKGIPNTYSRGASLIGPTPTDYGTGDVVQADIGYEDYTFQHNTVYSDPANGLASFISSNGDVFPQSYGTTTFSDNIWNIGANSTYTGGFSWTGQTQFSWCTLPFGVPRLSLGATATMTRETIVGAASTTGSCLTVSPYSGQQFPSNTRNAATPTDTWVDAPNGNFTVNPAFTACIGTAADGRNCGADVAYVTAMTGSAVSGTFNQFLDFQIRGSAATSSSVNIQYTAPSTAACTVAISASQTLSPTIGPPSQSRLGKSGSVTLSSGLSSGTLYYFGITCIGVQLRGTFTTL